MAHRQRGRRRRYRGGLVAQVFDEAQRRDPTHARRWVALVDGANHQLDRIEAEAKARKVNVFVLIDVIHVLEYLWKAVWCFYPEGDPHAETWVHDKARAVLAGRATGVIEGACRHLVKDRLDLTGARWGLQGAEAVLKLRAIRCNGDWDTYWAYHLAQERRRVHESRYADNIIPRAA